MDFSDFCNVCALAGEFTAEDAAELRQVFRNKSVLRAFGKAIAEANSAAGSLVGINLTTHEGLAEALRIQGTVRGVVTLVSRLIELQEMKDDSNG